MSGLVKARRVVGLLLLELAAVLLGSMLNAPDADAKEKKKLNVVQCQVGLLCFGISAICEPAPVG
jgi:hypothetical protein